MKRLLVVIGIVLCFSGNAFAELNNLNNVFEKLDELAVRIDSGISINSFAESFADLRAECRKILTTDARIDNPLLFKQVTELIDILNDYSEAWKVQGTEDYKYFSANCDVARHLKSRYSGMILIYDNHNVLAYSVSDTKRLIFGEFTEKLHNVKTVPRFGW